MVQHTAGGELLVPVLLGMVGEIESRAPGVFSLQSFFLVGASQGALVVKNLPVRAGGARDKGSIPEARRSPGVGNGNQLQYSRLENSTARSSGGYSLGRKELDATEHHVYILSCTEHGLAYPGASVSVC